MTINMPSELKKPNKIEVGIAKAREEMTQYEFHLRNSTLQGDRERIYQLRVADLKRQITFDLDLLKELDIPEEVAEKK